MNYIWLKIASPLQSWGGDAISFEIRPTHTMPTFSGIIGLLCSCLGISYRKEPEKVEELRDAIRMDVYPLYNNNKSILNDFQGAGGGIDHKESSYHKREIPWSRKIGEEKRKLKNQIYYKHYLQDCKFDIILYVEDSTLAESIAQALKNPEWAPFLGRRSCHLTEPPLGGVFQNMDKVRSIWKKENRRHDYLFKHVTEIGDNTSLVKDYPLCKGNNSTTIRYVQEIKCQ